MKSRSNTYRYKTHTGEANGFFNIYQAKNGCIVIVLSNGFAILNYKQIIDLLLDVLSLNDFNPDQYARHYREQIIEYENSILKSKNKL